MSDDSESDALFQPDAPASVIASAQMFLKTHNSPAGLAEKVRQRALRTPFNTYRSVRVLVDTTREHELEYILAHYTRAEVEQLRLMAFPTAFGQLSIYWATGLIPKQLKLHAYLLRVYHPDDELDVTLIARLRGDGWKELNPNRGGTLNHAELQTVLRQTKLLCYTYEHGIAARQWREIQRDHRTTAIYLHAPIRASQVDQLIERYGGGRDVADYVLSFLYPTNKPLMNVSLFIPKLRADHHFDDVGAAIFALQQPGMPDAAGAVRILKRIQDDKNTERTAKRQKQQNFTT